MPPNPNGETVMAGLKRKDSRLVHEINDIDGKVLSAP
jgi:hypothetical protein